MVVPAKFARRFIYHFTHLDNLESVLRLGLLANNHPNAHQAPRRSIASAGIQERRATMNVPCGPGGVVHDYVPLYFGSLSPMLLGVINKKNVDQLQILYLEYPITLLERDDVVFTDASANTNEPPNFYSDPEDLERLNWPEIDSRKWSSKSEVLRHQRMAEALVNRELSVQQAARIVVWNGDVAAHVKAVAEQLGVAIPQTTFESRDSPHYFKDFLHGEGNRSVVTGPMGIRNQFNEACEKIADRTGSGGGKYASLQELLLALRAEFGCLPQTAELVGLKSANGIHKLPVDQHTLEVVAALKALPEFMLIQSANDRDLVELAAYLHDIGKGPKSRWAKWNGVQQVDPDHPVRALPMLSDILTSAVASVPKAEGELLLKLVCYHDLVGEVIGKGRDEQQIADAFKSERELEMLFALAKADITSLRDEWWNDEKVQGLFDRLRAGLLGCNEQGDDS